MTESLKIKEGIGEDKGKRHIFRVPTTKRETLPEYQRKLESLQCFSEVKEKIKLGMSPTQIADFVMSERTEDFATLMTTKDTFIEWVILYRKRMPPAELASIRMPKEIERAAERVRHGVDVLEEMEDLYKIQKERINIDYSIEKKMKKLFKNTGNEIAIASELLRTLVQLRVELGIDNLQSNEAEVIKTRLIEDFGAKTGRAEVMKVLNDPKSVSRVLGVAESLFASLSTEEAAKLLEQGLSDEVEVKEDEDAA